MVSKTSMDTQALTIDMAGAEYGIVTDSIKEIARIVETTPVPEAPSFVVGAIDYRGDLVVVVDLAARLALGKAKADLSSYIVIVERDGRRVGLLVDTVRDVVILDADAIMAAPANLPLPEELLAGAYEADDRLLLLLDIAPVMDFSDADLLKKLKKQKKQKKVKP